jgi:hypothetical protein
VRVELRLERCGGALVLTEHRQPDVHAGTEPQLVVRAYRRTVPAAEERVDVGDDLRLGVVGGNIDHGDVGERGHHRRDPGGDDVVVVEQRDTGHHPLLVYPAWWSVNPRD